MRKPKKYIPMGKPAFAEPSSSPEQTPLREATYKLVQKYTQCNVKDCMNCGSQTEEHLALHHQRIQSLIDRLPENPWKNKVLADEDMPISKYRRLKEKQIGFDRATSEVRHLLEGELL